MTRSRIPTYHPRKKDELPWGCALTLLLVLLGGGLALLIARGVVLLAILKAALDYLQ